MNAEDETKDNQVPKGGRCENVNNPSMSAISSMPPTHDTTASSYSPSVAVATNETTKKNEEIVSNTQKGARSSWLENNDNEATAPLVQPTSRGGGAADTTTTTTVEGGHKRNISWDPVARPGCDGGEFLLPPRGGGGGGGEFLLPPRPPPVQTRQTTISSTGGGGGGGGKISLRDLVEHNPLESEADTYIQSALEQVDPTRPGLLSLPQTTILGNVPQEVLGDAFIALNEDQHDNDGSISQPYNNNNKSSTAGSHCSSSPSRRHHNLHHASTTTTSPQALPLFKAQQQQKKPATSTAEDLWQLTRDMQKLDQRPSLTRGTGMMDASSRMTGSGDVDNSLVNNAVHILRRNVSSAQQKQSGIEDNNKTAPTIESEVINAADRWKKLKIAVANPKKSDIPTPDVTEEVDAEIGNAGQGRQTEDLLQGETDHEGDGDDDNNTNNQATRNENSQNRYNGSIRKNRAITEYKDFEAWFQFKKVNTMMHIKVVLGLMIVATSIAAILFYLVGNPPCSDSNFNCYYDVPTGTNTTDTSTSFSSFAGSVNYFARASASWWILFLCCRQAVTFTLSRVTEAAIIDYLALRSKHFVRIFGPFFTLFVVQSRGWPFLLFSWGMYDFILLFGENRFAQHWLFWQNAIGLFSEQNPSGGITSSNEYQTILVVALVVSFVVTVKRFWIGLRQGRGTYQRYGDDLANIMKKSLMVGKVAALARDIANRRIENFSFQMFEHDLYNELEGENIETGSLSLDGMQQPTSRKNLLSDVNTSSRRARLDELLGAWEEPDAQKESLDDVTIASIIQFRQSLTYLNESFPFGGSFGLASTRQECIESAEAVYHRLMLCTPSRECLTFDVLALLAVHDNGELDEEKMKALIKLFRPDRDGNLTLLDFAKSVDSIYKELRLLRANVANSSKLDKAFEAIFNVFFYALMICIVLAAIGINPLVLFASISGFVLGFSFMIGAACSKYFEGLLLIFVRRPYDIGDRIAVSNPFGDTASNGSPAWVVKDIDLYTTTVVYCSTNELATVSNGSLASFRIINCARSPKGSLSFLLKFSIDTSYTKLQVFKSALEKFIKARPREWVSFSAFRATRVEADLGFVEYTVNALHRESWQNASALAESRAQLASFALELSKKMDMRYVVPAMPVDLNMKQRGDAKDVLELLQPTMEVRERAMTEDSRFIDVADSVAAVFGTKLSPRKQE